MGRIISFKIHETINNDVAKKDDVKDFKEIIKSLEEKINKYINSGDKEIDL